MPKVKFAGVFDQVTAAKGSRSCRSWPGWRRILEQRTDVLTRELAVALHVQSTTGIPVQNWENNREERPAVDARRPQKK
jgi:hypothetical protein